MGPQLENKLNNISYRPRKTNLTGEKTLSVISRGGGLISQWTKSIIMKGKVC